MAKKGKVLTTVIDITGSIDPQLSKSIKAASGMIDTMKASSVAFSAAAVAATSAAMAGITAAASYLTDLGGAYDSAANGIAATTGLVGEELEGLETAMQAVYGAQYGESLQEIADGVSEVFRLMKVTGEELVPETADKGMDYSHYYYVGLAALFILGHRYTQKNNRTYYNVVNRFSHLNFLTFQVF